MSDHHAPKDGKVGWFDKPENIKMFLSGLYAACFIVFVAGFFVEMHPYFGIEEVRFFYAIWGFICFAFIVLFGQHLRKLVGRSEDYYDK